MSKKVRVRFAPSPTGPLHIGGVRTALFNYLFAKKHSGDFILRIEDTDQTRYVEGAEQYIIDSLNWCNIPFDEGPGKDKGFGPYRQSERKHLYKQYADQLIAEGKAYYAFDTSDELDTHRKDHEAKGKTFIYNWHNRLKLKNSLSLSAEEVEAKLGAGDDYVIRFLSPQDETLQLQDIIRGDINIDTNILDDKVLFKSDGMPTYHLANIVDDHLMEITHVIRGEEWLPSLALHQQLYDAFGWQAPEFAHLPLILKPAGFKGKLSKRDGDKIGMPVFPLQWFDKKNNVTLKGFREEGYFPEAIINMLVLLGWNEGEGVEREIYTLDELISVFSLDHVTKSGGKFNPDKTKWFNQQYLQLKNDEELAELFKETLPLDCARGDHKDYLTSVVGLIKERATFVSDLWSLSSFLFEAPTSYDEKASKKAWKEGTALLMDELIGLLESMDDLSVANVQDFVKSWIGAKEIGFGKVMMPLRLSLVGSLQGPDVFTIASMIGKEETIARIQKAIDTL